MQTIQRIFTPCLVLVLSLCGFSTALAVPDSSYITNDEKTSLEALDIASDAASNSQSAGSTDGRVDEAPAVPDSSYTTNDEETSLEAVETASDATSNSQSAGSDDEYAVDVAQVDPAIEQQVSVQATGTELNWSRIWGADCYETAYRIACEGHPGKTQQAVLVTGESYHDALAAAGLAGQLDAPILLTPSSGGLGAWAKAFITEHKVSKVTVAGGAKSVPQAAQDELEAAGVEVQRIWGKDAIETAYQVACDLKASNNQSSDTVIVATSSSFYDAVSVSPYAAAVGLPVLLTDASGNLSARTFAEAASYKKAIIVGGRAVIPDSLISQLQDSGCLTIRLWGESAYDTSSEIAYWLTGTSTKDYAFGPTVRFSFERTAFATGAYFSDALAGGPLQGARKAPLLLFDTPSVSSSVSALARWHLGDRVSRIFFLGGIDSAKPSMISGIAEWWHDSRPNAIEVGQISATYCVNAIGSRYSQDNRWDAGVYDCSSLAYRSYCERKQQMGLDIDALTRRYYDNPYDVCFSAANEAFWCEDNKLTVNPSDLRPGDWIFYGGSDNGRYRGIYHVAIYLGNGQQVEAKGYSEGVTNGSFRPSNIGLYARPSLILYQ